MLKKYAAMFMAILAAASMTMTGCANKDTGSDLADSSLTVSDEAIVSGEDTDGSSEAISSDIVSEESSAEVSDEESSVESEQSSEAISSATSSEEESSATSSKPTSSKDEFSATSSKPTSSKEESSAVSKPTSSKEESSAVSKPTSSKEESSATSSKPTSSKEESSATSSKPTSSKEESSATSSKPTSSKEESSAVSSETSSKEETASKSCADLYAAAINGLDMPFMGVYGPNAEDNNLFDYYYLDLNPADLSDYCVAIPMMMVHATEVAIFKPVDKAAAKSVKAAIDTRVKQLEQSWEGYLPEQYELVQNYKIVEQDGYILFVVSYFPDEIAKQFKAALK